MMKIRMWGIWRVWGRRTEGRMEGRGREVREGSGVRLLLLILINTSAFTALFVVLTPLFLYFWLRSAIGRVEWNVTGYFPSSPCSSLANPIPSTILSSAGNDGRIRLWKATSGSVWRSAGSIGIEDAEQEPESAYTDVDMDGRQV
jgi:hypothetical protein